MRLIARSLLLCLALSPLSPARAEPMEGLYRVVEPLPDAQAGGREEGLRRAFDTLLVRLTGKPELVKSEALAELRDNPQPVIRQFGYQADAVTVEFDPAAVQQRLSDAGIDVWGAERPEILTWWLIDSGYQTQLVGDGQDRAEVLEAAARYRGLPLRLPLADLGEQLTVTDQTVTQPARLTEVSSRYSADALLGVLAREQDGRWQANWQLQLGDQQTGGQAAGDSLAAVADAVMFKAQIWLAPKFERRAGQAEPVLLEIENVDVARFAEIERLLQPLGGQLVSVSGDRVTYRLTVDPAQLRTQLGLARLQEVPIEAAPVPAGGSATGASDTQPLDATQAPQAPQMQDAPPAGPQALHLRFR